MEDETVAKVGKRIVTDSERPGSRELAGFLGTCTAFAARSSVDGNRIGHVSRLPDAVEQSFI
jgi:hypothetical protein